jgi:hypothetical protein
MRWYLRWSVFDHARECFSSTASLYTAGLKLHGPLQPAPVSLSSWLPMFARPPPASAGVLVFLATHDDRLPECTLSLLCIVGSMHRLAKSFVSLLPTRVNTQAVL